MRPVGRARWGGCPGRDRLTCIIRPMGAPKGLQMRKKPQSIVAAPRADGSFEGRKADGIAGSLAE